MQLLDIVGLFMTIPLKGSSYSVPGLPQMARRFKTLSFPSESIVSIQFHPVPPHLHHVGDKIFHLVDVLLLDATSRWQPGRAPCVFQNTV